MKLKEFLKGHGFLQHLACFLLYVFTVPVSLLLWEVFEDSSEWVIVGISMLSLPVVSWIFYLLYCDVAAVGRWLWRLIVPEKWRKAINEFFAPEVVVRMGNDAIVRKSHALYLRRNGTLTPVTIAQARELADSYRSRQASSAVEDGKSANANKASEMEIFRMWEDAVVWKDGGLYYRKNGEYEPITVERARELERGYHSYQASMDVDRGGMAWEDAARNRGFENGNYVAGYAVDRFLDKRSGIAWCAADVAVVQSNTVADTVQCRQCGAELKENQQHKRGSSVYCLDCFKELEAAAKKRDHEARKSMWELKQWRNEKFKKQDEQTEHVIFRMWDDAVVWKDGQLQLRKKGEYTPITLEQAREQEREYHRYQMSMDVNRGGLPDEVAQRARGFDSDGNYVGRYAVDEFWTKRFGYAPQDEQEITVTRCMRCGKKLDEPVKAKSGSYIRCRECMGDAQVKPAEVKPKKPAETKCARCGSMVIQDEITVREGAAYCASCANRLKIKSKAKPNEIRCERCGKLLKAGEVVSRGGAPYCKKCGDMPDAAKDQPVFETPHWSIVWNDGKLYKYEKYGGYRRIRLYEARELEREHMLGMWLSCLERGLLSEEKANETYRIKDGKYAGPYAVDALTDGRSGTAIFSLHADSVIWKDGGVHHLRSSGECLPITMDEARKLEFDYWNDLAARAYREGDVKLYEVAQGRIKETKNGFRLKAYAVDEFMRKQATADARSKATDDQPGTKICDVYHGELIWKDGGLHYQKYRGECTPVTREKAQELERLDWSYNADHIYRMGASMEHVRLVEGFDENGNRTRNYAVDEFMKRRAEAVCTRCGAKHYAPLEDLIAPDFGCKSCGNPVKARKVDKKFSPADIVVDGLIYRRIYAGMMLIGAEIGTKEAVVRSRVDSPVCIVEGVVLGCENDVPLVRIALREYDPGLKLTFEPGFRIDFRSDDYSKYMKQYGIGSLSNLPGFTCETVKNIAHYYNPDIVQEVVHRSETQTIREKFEYHGFDAVYTMELE